MSTVDEPLSFETAVRPMFRDRDRRSMEFAFDLWSYDDVSKHADAILAASRPARCPATARGRESRSTSSNVGSTAKNRADHTRRSVNRSRERGFVGQ
jgi:hypothetical protein